MMNIDEIVHIQSTAQHRVAFICFRDQSRTSV